MSESEGGSDPRDAGRAGASSDGSDPLDADALLSRLRVIEDQPLETRAAAFAQINEELQSRLDGDAGGSA